MEQLAQGNLPSDTKIIPKREGKEHCKTIVLRSGKITEKRKKNNARKSY